MNLFKKLAVCLSAGAMLSAAVSASAAPVGYSIPGPFSVSPFVTGEMILLTIRLNATQMARKARSRRVAFFMLQGISFINDLSGMVVTVLSQSSPGENPGYPWSRGTPAPLDDF